MYHCQEFGRNMKRIREEKGLKQNELARLADISPQQISKYENAKNSTMPSIDVAAKIAEALEVTIDELCGAMRNSNRGIKLETYADAIEYIGKLVHFFDCRANVVDVPLHYLDYYEEPIGIDPNGEYITKDVTSDIGAMIVVADHRIGLFIKQWNSIKKLIDDGTIDVETATTWYSGALSKLQGALLYPRHIPFSFGENAPDWLSFSPDLLCCRDIENPVFTDALPKED